ncbi:hypothetical protein SAMN06295967_110106 [Belliella buryatensis]|uniref:Uncharacterized protein n=2 Tax=Belliella buryatensis TaxID=1500549 RepID=A0A239ESR9_9BACT|nr:hypothetical protein SAMN06295967_110106 [Belliella buryatensis]
MSINNEVDVTLTTMKDYQEKNQEKRKGDFSQPKEKHENDRKQEQFGQVQAGKDHSDRQERKDEKQGSNIISEKNQEQRGGDQDQKSGQFVRSNEQADRDQRDDQKEKR